MLSYNNGKKCCIRRNSRQMSSHTCSMEKVSGKVVGQGSMWISSTLLRVRRATCDRALPSGTTCQRQPSPVAELQPKQVGWHTAPLSNYRWCAQRLSAFQTWCFSTSLCSVEKKYDSRRCRSQVASPWKLPGTVYDYNSSVNKSGIRLWTILDTIIWPSCDNDDTKPDVQPYIKCLMEPWCLVVVGTAVSHATYCR